MSTMLRRLEIVLLTIYIAKPVTFVGFAFNQCKSYSNKTEAGEKKQDNVRRKTNQMHGIRQPVQNGILSNKTKCAVFNYLQS